MSDPLGWKQTFDEEIQRLIDETGVGPAQWRSGGRKTANNPAGEDIAWWMGEGLSQVTAYAEWLRSSNLRIATLPDGQPGIEWRTQARLLPNDPDSTPISMAADLIVETGPESTMIIDIKSGQKEPTSPHQLALYSTLIGANLDMAAPNLGAFYMSRRAVMTAPVPLGNWGVVYWTNVVRQLTTAIRHQIFLPNVGWQCTTCSLRKYCSAREGMEQEQDSLTWVTPPEPPEIDHLSWSQLSTWLYCGKQYELARIRGLKETPSVWLAAGVAVHKVCEQIALDYYGAQQ